MRSIVATTLLMAPFATDEDVIQGIFPIDVIDLSAKAVVGLFILGLFRGWIVVRPFYLDVKEERDVLRKANAELLEAVSKFAEKDDAALRALETVADVAQQNRDRGAS